MVDLLAHDVAASAHLLTHGPSEQELRAPRRPLY
jgi:hypothetical protein